MATFPYRLVALAGMVLLGGCVAYPYQTSFQTCDNAAGACYRGCEDYAGTPEYGQCHADCEYSADRCFDNAYEPYRYSYGYPSTWRGRYGYWYPDSGYAFSFSYRYGDPYYGRRYYGPRRHHRDDWRDRRRGNDTPSRDEMDAYADPDAPSSRSAPRFDEDAPASRSRLPRRAAPDRSGGSSQSDSSQPARAPRAQPAPEPPRDSGSGVQPKRSSSTPAKRRPKRAQPRRETPRGEPDRDLD